MASRPSTSYAEVSASEQGTEMSTLDDAGPSVEPTAEKIQRKPWKFIGYRGYAKFIASEDDFSIFRRFQTLNARVTLAMQDEISALEEELCQLDEQYSQKDALNLNNGTFRDDLEDRSMLLARIGKKLYKYSGL